MTWFVCKNPDGTETRIRVLDEEEATDMREDFVKQGIESWVEESDEKRAEA